MEWELPPPKRIDALLSLYASAMQKPFEIETTARQELQRDRLFPVLTPEQRDFYLCAALEIGERQAARCAGRDLDTLAAELGASVWESDGDGVTAGTPVYAEYDAGIRRITLYQAGIARLACRLGSTLHEADARRHARELLLAHELFHHMEATSLGPVHLTLPPVAVPFAGGLWRVQRRVLRTREIAAHSFAHTLLVWNDCLERG